MSSKKLNCNDLESRIDNLENRLDEMEFKLTKYIEEQLNTVKREFAGELNDLNDAIKEELMDVRNQASRAFLIGTEAKDAGTALSTSIHDIQKANQEKKMYPNLLRETIFFIVKLFLSGVVALLLIGKKIWDLLKEYPVPSLHAFDKAFPPTKPMFEIYQSGGSDIFSSPFFSVEIDKQGNIENKPLSSLSQENLKKQKNHHPENSRDLHSLASLPHLPFFSDAPWVVRWYVYGLIAFDKVVSGTKKRRPKLFRKKK
jgi:hypothetical protein